MVLEDLKPIEKDHIRKYRRTKTEETDYNYEKSNGKMGYICPHCNYINLIQVKFMIETNAEMRVDYMTSNLTLTMRCKKCKERFYTSILGIDPNICEIIVKLNNLGYKTKYSCEGHVYNNGFITRPYIIFTDSEIIEKYGTPEDWIYKIKTNGDIKIMYRIDEGYDNNGEKKLKALNALEDWVNSLKPKEES